MPITVRPVRADYQPPLTRWSHTWRLMVMLVISALAFGTRLEVLERLTWWIPLDFAVGLACYVLVWWRRRYPVLVCTLTNVAGFVSATAAGPATLALVSLSTRRRWREIVPQAILALTTASVTDLWLARPPSSEDTPLVVEYGFLVAIIGMTIAWGLYLGSRRELIGSWRARAIAAESEQHAKVQQARSVERARIAREMHDVLAHRISAVSMHAGALVYRADLPREEVAAAAKTIQENSHLALTELREVLGVLREGPGDADPESPQAGPTDVDALVVENRTAGMRIDYTRDVDITDIPATTGRTLYRCVQEALTNARKHAPAAAVTVRIDGNRADGVRLRVANPLPIGGSSLAPESGFGLIGLAERVALSGGRESHSVTDDSFVLDVWLPCQP
ncbi:histidine kinase [Gordonia sinesedis]